MGIPVFSEDIIYRVSDVTAGVFLIVLIISITLQTTRRTALTHLYAAAVLILAGIFVRMSAATIAILSEGSVWRSGVRFLSPAVETTVWIMSFSLIMLGITESVTHVIYMNDAGSRRAFEQRIAAYAIITVAGSVLFILTKDINVFSAAILAHFCYCILHLRKNWPRRALREFVRAAAFAMATFALALAFDQIRLTGLGLSIMILILGEQYHNHVRQDLAEKEAALAKSKVQLLADQISPHYIYNSLQGISGLCETDPAAAQKAIDVFSNYLRANLESLTEEDLIPFTAELEHTKAYLELERLGGLRRFVADYDLQVTDFMLPPLVLQPLVENAVKHGAAAAANSGATATNGSAPDAADATLITISTRDLGDSICIKVADSSENHERDEALSHESDFSKKTPESAKNSQKKSVGLENVRTRLTIQCGGTLELKKSENGATAIIILPKN